MILKLVLLRMWTISWDLLWPVCTSHKPTSTAVFCLRVQFYGICAFHIIMCFTKENVSLLVKFQFRFAKLEKQHKIYEALNFYKILKLLKNGQLNNSWEFMHFQIICALHCWVLKKHKYI